MKNYIIKSISKQAASEYIAKNHYSHGCSNSISPCYGLYDESGDNLIGVCAFSTPCSEYVCCSVFGAAMKRNVTELHRLHILDGTPKNTESWFISRCLKRLTDDRPDIKAVISFSDLTEGHTGVIYKATNAYRIGTTRKRTFYIDESGRLRHPRQCGHNLTKGEAEALGWQPVQRAGKNRYLWLIAKTRAERRYLQRICKLLQNERDSA